MSFSGPDIAKRLSERIAELGLTENRASTMAGTDRGYIGQLRRLSSSRSPTVKNLHALAKTLGLRLSWVIDGEGPRLLDDHPNVDHSYIVVDRSFLRKAIDFVLTNEGVPAERARLVADILPEALAGPPIDEVDHDPLRSFRVHFQLGSRPSERRSPA